MYSQNRNFTKSEIAKYERKNKQKQLYYILNLQNVKGTRPQTYNISKLQRSQPYKPLKTNNFKLAS